MAATDQDPFALAIDPALFQEHLDVVQSRSRVVALDAMLSGEKPDVPVLSSITFDDGYVDNLRVASPLLVRAGLPATFFVCTGALGDGRGFWWDRLASAMAAAPDPSAALAGMEGIGPFGDLTRAEARTQATLDIASLLQPMPPTARDELLAELEARLDAGAHGRQACPVLDEAGVRELGSQPLTELGAHTHGHPMLSRLPHDEQLDEINRSIAAIHDITGTRPQFMAYPYGSKQDYNDDSQRAASDAGMRAAFVNHNARFDPVGSPYRVPRYYVPPLPADRFRTWLDELLAA